MKTAVTVINTVQTGMDNYKDVRTTKIFSDESTLLEIKQWIKEKNGFKDDVTRISLSAVEISDVL